MHRKRPAIAVLAGALCLVTAACGGSSSSTDTENAGKGERSGAGYPVTLKNCGRTTTYTKAPSRVVVTNGASVAEVSALLALGLGDRIVANQQWYGASEVAGRAKAIKELPDGGIKPNDAFGIAREAMLGLRPDLVLGTTGYAFTSGNGFATRDDLATVAANSYISPEGCDEDTSKMTIEDSYQLLRDLGKIFQVEKRAEKLIADSKRRIAEVSDKIQAKGDKKKPRVMVVFSNMSMGGNDFSSVAANGIWNDILAKAGGTNAFSSATKNTFADLSKEKVAAEPVDALVVMGYQDKNPAAYARKLIKEFPQWPAAKNNRYIVLSDSIYLGPSNDVAVDKLGKMLHPEALGDR